jgi:hypothetical protein
MRITKTSVAVVGAALCGVLTFTLASAATAENNQESKAPALAPATAAAPAEERAVLRKQFEVIQGSGDLGDAISDLVDYLLDGGKDQAKLDELEKKVNDAAKSLFNSTSNVGPVHNRPQQAPAQPQAPAPEQPQQNPQSQQQPHEAPLPSIPSTPKRSASQAAEPIDDVQKALDQLRKDLDALLNAALHDPSQILPKVQVLLDDLVRVVLAALHDAGLNLPPQPGTTPPGTTPPSLPTIPTTPGGQPQPVPLNK